MKKFFSGTNWGMLIFVGVVVALMGYGAAKLHRSQRTYAAPIESTCTVRDGNSISHNC